MTPARILIVEDESIVAKDIQASLSGLGYAVAGVAADGEEAVRQAESLKPDLILMDVMLQGALDGIEAAKRIRRLSPVPVVYLTAYTDDDTLRRAKGTDAFGYLLKPFEDRELRTTIEMALSKHSLERQLRESREWLRTTLRCISDAVLATDAAGAIQFMNPLAESLTGWEEDAARNRKLTDVLCLMRGGDIALRERDLAEMLTRGAEVAPAADCDLITRDGRRVPVAHSAAPIRDARGEILGIVASFRDIRVQKEAQAREQQLQDRLFRAQRMESLGSLAGGVAHTLNSILGPMVNYPDLIARNLPADSALRQDLEIIKNSARKALDIIRDLLTLGRIGNFPMEPMDLNAVVDRALASPATLRLQRGAPLVIVSRESEPRLPSIRGSPGLLQELVFNLLVHGYAAMPQGGSLTVSTSRQTLREPVAGYELIRPDSYVVLRVRDTGAGVSEQALNRLFEPFQASAQPGRGSGLELALVYAIVKEHQGFIDVRSAPGQGTDVLVYCPVCQAAPVRREAAGDADLHGAETVLVVDDEEEQRRVAARWLRTAGYRVLTAASGSEAVGLLDAAAQGRGAPIDLVLLDMILGDEQDGLDIYRMMLDINPRQKAVLTSGFAATDRIKEALKLGAGQHLQKPYEMEDLGRAVRRELDRF